MSITEKTLEVSLSSTKFESQALVITVRIDYKETVSPQSSHSDFSHNANPNIGNKNSLHGSYTSLLDKMETQDVPGIVLSTARNDSKNPKKNLNLDPDSSKSTMRKIINLKDSAFLNSKIMPPTLKPSRKPNLDRDDSWTSHLSTEKFQFRCHLTSLYMVSTP